MAAILIIDDDEHMRRLLSRILKDAGHTLYEAQDGRDGIAICRKEKPDLVISDIIMPDMEGIETILELRRDMPGLPIIAISGGGSPTYLEFATKLGATAALEKPFTADDLQMLVRRLLG